jgi:hypothetical protein
MSEWRFWLPTASAILAMLYPDNFTVYDIRTCDEICACGKGDFYKLGGRLWSRRMWPAYQQFTNAVTAAAPGLSLRDCDRRLWGHNKRRQMDSELSLPTF